MKVDSTDIPAVRAFSEKEREQLAARRQEIITLMSEGRMLLWEKERLVTVPKTGWLERLNLRRRREDAA